MFPNCISITELQRHLKKVFASKIPFQVVLSNNKVSGLVLSKEFTEILLQSDVLNQVREELWELNDKETVDLIKRDRAGKTKPIPFDKAIEGLL